MSQLTKYVFVLIIFISIHENCFAKNEDSQLCSNRLPQYEITYTEDPIDYHLDKRSRDLISEFNKSEYTLGYFHSTLTVGKRSIFTTFTDNKNSCTDLTKLQLNLQFKPIIYISKEAQSFKCTFDRTITHEHTHYQIEKSSFLMLLQKIDVIVKKHFDDFNDKKYINRDAEMDIRLNALINDINLTLESQTKLQHSLLDTEENYVKESQVCDEKENELLDRLFQLDL